LLRPISSSHDDGRRLQFSIGMSGDRTPRQSAFSFGLRDLTQASATALIAWPKEPNPWSIRIWMARGSLPGKRTKPVMAMNRFRSHRAHGSRILMMSSIALLARSIRQPGRMERRQRLLDPRRKTETGKANEVIASATARAWSEWPTGRHALVPRTAASRGRSYEEEAPKHPTASPLAATLAPSFNPVPRGQEGAN
jgi:hypothetical protein